jgi:hypothetical protein
MEGKPMSVIDKLNDRIRSKITPEISARITAMRGREQGIEIASETRDPPWADIHDSMWAFSHRAAAQADARKAQVEDTVPGMRM